MPDYFVASEGSVIKNKFQILGLQRYRKNSYVQRGKDLSFTSIKRNLLSYSSRCIQGLVEKARPRHQPGVLLQDLVSAAGTSRGHLPGCGSSTPGFHVTSAPTCHGDTCPAWARAQWEAIYDAKIPSDTWEGAEGPPLHGAAALRDTRQEWRHRSTGQGGTCSCHPARSSAIPGMWECTVEGHRTPWPCVGAHRTRWTTRPWPPNLKAGRLDCPPALPQPSDSSQGQGEDMELRGRGKLHTSWPQCPRHTYFITAPYFKFTNRMGLPQTSTNTPASTGACAARLQQASLLGFWKYNNKRWTSTDFFFLRPGHSLHPLCSGRWLQSCCWCPHPRGSGSTNGVSSLHPPTYLWKFCAKWSPWGSWYSARFTVVCWAQPFGRAQDSMGARPRFGKKTPPQTLP